MRDVISDFTLQQINAVLDEILVNLNDNVRNIEVNSDLPNSSALPVLANATNYDDTVISIKGSAFRLITRLYPYDELEVNPIDNDAYTVVAVVGDKNGVCIYDIYEYHPSELYKYFFQGFIRGINGGGYKLRIARFPNTGEGSGYNTICPFELSGLTIGNLYTVSFTGKWNYPEYGTGTSKFCIGTTVSDVSAQNYVVISDDLHPHEYTLTFTASAETMYLNFDFGSVDWDYVIHDDYDNDDYVVTDLILSGMEISVVDAWIPSNGTKIQIPLGGGGGGTSDLDAIELTYAEYQALTPAEKTDPDKIYFITDYPSGSGVVINPTGTATDTAETIEVDGTIYDFAGTDADAVHTADIGVAGGVAELDSNGKVPSAQLPSYVDDVVEYASISAFPATGESGKIYIALDTNKTYRWTGSVYVEISPSLALGETSSTAYRGDRGKTAYDHSQSDHSGIAPAFTEASTRANIASGETFATLLGKIKKFFSDLKAVAFSGSYNDLSDTPNRAGSNTDGGAATYVNGRVYTPTSSTWRYLFFSNTVSDNTSATPYYNDGLRYKTLQGTAETEGESTLSIGNGTASGTAGNKTGGIRLYGSGTACGVFKFGGTSTNRTYTFPNATGTVALKEDYTNFTAQTVTSMPETNYPITSGWRRVCKVSANTGTGYASGIILLGGGYNTGAPTIGVIGFSIMSDYARFTLLNCSYVGITTKIRAVRFSGGTYWIDVYIVGTSGSSGQTMARQHLTFMGNYVLSDIQNSSAVYTDTVTAVDELEIVKIGGRYVQTKRGDIQYIENTAGNTPLRLKSNTTYTYLSFRDSADSHLGSIGVNSDHLPQFTYGGTDSRIPLITNSDTNALISTLPTWTTDPTDDTYLIRRSATGSATFGQVKFSTIWSYIKSKADAIYMKVSTKPTQIFNKIPTDSAVTSTISSIADYNFLIFNITSNAYKSINWGSYIIPVAIVSSNYGSAYNGIIVRSMLNTSQYVEIVFLSATSVSIKGTNWQNSERVICYAY